MRDNLIIAILALVLVIIPVMVHQAFWTGYNKSKIELNTCQAVRDVQKLALEKIEYEGKK